MFSSLTRLLTLVMFLSPTLVVLDNDYRSRTGNGYSIPGHVVLDFLRSRTEQLYLNFLTLLVQNHGIYIFFSNSLLVVVIDMDIHRFLVLCDWVGAFTYVSIKHAFPIRFSKFFLDVSFHSHDL